MGIDVDISRNAREHKLVFQGYDEVLSLALDSVFAHDNQGVIGLGFFQNSLPVGAEKLSNQQIDSETGMPLLSTKCIGRYTISYPLAMKMIDLLTGLVEAMRANAEEAMAAHQVTQAQPVGTEHE